MSDRVHADPRAVEDKGVPKFPRLVDPETSSLLDAERYRSITRRYLIHGDGSPYTLDDLERSNLAHAEVLEERHLWRFQRPDGSILETSWKGMGTASTAMAFASYYRLSLLGELRNDSTPPSEPPPAPLTPPPVVQAPPSRAAPLRKAKPRPQPPPGITPAERGIKDSRPTAQDRIGGSAPSSRTPPGPMQPRTTPIRVPEESLGEQLVDYFKKDFLQVTATESMPLISTLFGRVADALDMIPPLKGVAKLYKAIAEFADAVHLLYELIHEMSQAEALEKGGKEVVKRTKPARLVAEKILSKKYPKMPENVRKKIAGMLEALFERYVSDPAIKKGRETMEKMDKDKELQRPFIEELKSIQKMIRDSF